jgi:hypothetical protein
MPATIPGATEQNVANSREDQHIECGISLLAWTADEIVIRHEDPSIGKVNLHFPRVGFDTTPAQLLP